MNYQIKHLEIHAQSRDFFPLGRGEGGGGGGMGGGGSDGVINYCICAGEGGGRGSETYFGKGNGRLR